MTGGISKRASVAGGNRKCGSHPCYGVICNWSVSLPVLYSALCCESLPINLRIAFLIDILMSSSAVRKHAAINILAHVTWCSHMCGAYAHVGAHL